MNGEITPKPPVQKLGVHFSIQLVFITSLLFQHALIQGHFLCILLALLCAHPALYFPL